MSGAAPMHFSGPSTTLQPKQLKRKEAATKRPVWISEEVLSAVPPTMVANQMKLRSRKPQADLKTFLKGRTTPDLIAWEHAPRPDSEQTTQRGLLRPRRLFGPTRTRSDEAETRDRAYCSTVPSMRRNATVPDVLADLSVPKNTTRRNRVPRQNRPPACRGNPLNSQRLIQRIPSPVALCEDNAAEGSIHRELLSRRNRPASSSEREHRRRAVSSRSPHDLVRRLDKALRALGPLKSDAASSETARHDGPSIFKGGNHQRRTPRTLGSRLGRAVRAMKSQMTTTQPNSVLSSREVPPFICGGDATSKFNSITPMDTWIPRKSYCETCSGRDASSSRNTGMTATRTNDPIEMIHSIDLCGGDRTQSEPPVNEVRGARETEETTDSLKRNALQFRGSNSRFYAAIRAGEDRQQRLPGARSPAVLARRLGKALKNLESLQKALPAPAPPKTRERSIACCDQDFKRFPSPVRVWKPQPRPLPRVTYRTYRAPLRVDIGIQVGLSALPDRPGGTRRCQRACPQRKNMAANTARSPKKTAQTITPSGVHDPGRCVHPPKVVRKKRNLPRKQKSPTRRSHMKISSRKRSIIPDTFGSHFPFLPSAASSSQELLLRSPVSTPSTRSIFSIQKVQDMMFRQRTKYCCDGRERRGRHLAGEWHDLYRQHSRSKSPSYRLLLNL